MVQVGTGAVGRVIARHLVADPSVRELVLADLDAAGVREFATTMSAHRVRAVALDASDPAAVATILRGADVLVNATLPRFNGSLMAAAREARVAYLDLASASSDPFVDDAKWKAAGVPAVIAMGEDPGLSNLFARRGADRMESVESIRIRDGDTASSAEFPFICLFSPETFIGETLTASRVWQDGAYVRVPPFGGKETYAFPSPVGPQPVYEVDHEEVDTLPRFIGKGVRYVDFKLALDDRTVRILETFRDLRIFGDDRPDRVAARKALLEVIPKPADLVGKVDGAAALVVEVDGIHDGASRRLRVWTLLSHPEASRRFGATGTAYLTGTAGAVGALLLASGQITAPGMHSPETLDPAPFLPMLAARGIEVHEEEITKSARASPRGPRRDGH